MNFKKIPLLVTAAILALAVTLTCLPIMSSADDTATVTNNAYTDYSQTDNPNGVWTYQYRTKQQDGTYTYTDLTANSGVWGTSDTGTIKLVESCQDTSKPAVRFTASNDTVTELVLTYTAPENGTIQVSMANGGVFSVTRNGSGNGGIRFSMTHNGNDIKAVNDLDGGYITASNTAFFAEAQPLTVKKGDLIRFIVGKNVSKNIYADLNPEITYAQIEEAKPTEYNAADDYQSGTQTGQWRYYSRNSAGQYALLAVNGASWGVGANCSVGKANTDQVTGNSAINMHSGLSLDPTLAFVAPYTGTIELSMANGGIFAPSSGFDGVKLTVYINDSLYFESKVNSVNNYEGYRVWAEAQTIAVTAGDIIYFSVNKNANTMGDSVYLNPAVKYTEVVGEYDSTLRFLDTDTIESTNLYKDSFDISWPAARGGVADYTYTVYTSQTPITGIPTEGGIDVGAKRSYSFTGLESGTAYYIAVVATDGISKALLYNEEPVSTISKMFVFNAYDDYKTENQKSPWSYEYLVSGEYKKLEWNSTLWGNSGTTGSVTSAKSDLVTGKSAVVLEPSANSAVALTFTAPYTGTLDLSIANGGIMVPYNGAGNNWDGINLTLTQNGKELAKHEAITAANAHSSAQGAMYVGRVFTDTLNITVKAGDVIRFTVDKNKAVGNDKTFINPEIIYTSVAEGALDLHFEDGKTITGSGITDSEITAVLPTAFGGTGNYEYTLYYSKKPITSIPKSGGIALGNSTSYTLKALTSYTNYYFAATVSDGQNTAKIINSKAIATIGNTYTFNAHTDWTDGGQPINSPWRYYMQNIESGEYTEVPWNSESNNFSDKATAQSLTIRKTDSDLVTGGDCISVHPDTKYNSVIAFIAPYSGKITVSVANGGVFTPANGAAQEFDGTTFSVLKGEKVLYTKEGVSGLNNHNDRCFATGVSLTVKRGELIYFVVNKHTNVNADTTYLNPQIDYTFVEKGSDAFSFMPGASATGSNITETSMTLSWSSAFGPNGTATNYKVWISTSKLTKQPSARPAYSGKALKTELKGLTIGTQYYVYVLATDAKGATAKLIPENPVKTVSPTYNAYEQYNTTNGAGVWNYTLRSKDTATGEYLYTLAEAKESGGYGDATTTGSINKATSDQVTGKPAISMHSGTNNRAAALVFTAPYSGKISVSMANGGVFCPNNGEGANYDGISFIILKGNEEVYKLDEVNGKNNPVNNRLFTQPINLDIKQGEKLYFVVEANMSNASDSTYFNPLIEYLNITGGTGKVALEGFIVPETTAEDEENATDPLLTLYTRDNKAYTDTNVKGYTFGVEPEDNSWALWIILGGLGLAVVCGAVIILLNIKRKNK